MASKRTRSQVAKSSSKIIYEQDLEDQTSENLRFSKRCKFCLDESDLKDMWATYLCDSGEPETYGEMINECFSIPLEQPDYPEKICEMCVTRLKDACSFKREILEAGLILSEHIDGQEPDPKRVKVEFKVEAETEEDEPTNQDSDNTESHDEASKCGDGQDDEPDAEYLEVEYLEEEPTTARGSSEQAKDSTNEPKRKWPKKKKKHELTTTYKKYTEEELRKCLQAVRSNLMTRSEAAAYYHVPLKTVGAKIRAEANADAKDSGSDGEEDGDDPGKRLKLERQYKFIEEIKVILTYTNAIPYKTKTGHYYCSYCSTDGPPFYDANELRTHTRTKHAQERLRGVDLFMRPHFQNEVVKLDTKSLQCTVCCTPITAWNDLFQHLKDVHEIDLNEAYTRVIPYVLDDDLACALCHQKYPSYHILDGHMNNHYSNYICGQCGDTFLSETRLKKHVETHTIGRFPCKICGKIFSLEKYRKKHFEGVHNRESKLKCLYCTEKFRGEYARHFHVVEKHSEKVKTYTCEICGKTFDWRPYYLKHLRLTHQEREKKHKCSMCDKSFSMAYELRNHEDWHSNESSFVCAICKKKFSSKHYLQRHYTMHLAQNSTIVLV